MTATATAHSEIDIIHCLVSQNLYQRLGLKTNAVDACQIRDAYEARLALLRECHHEMKPGQPERAERLLEIAYQTLSDEQNRQRYDCRLERERAGQQFSSRVGPAIRSQGADDLGEAVELVGITDPLHPAFQLRQTTSWANILLNPALLFQPDGKRQRTFLLIVGSIAASSLLLLTTSQAHVDPHLVAETAPSPVDEPLSSLESHADSVSSSSSGPSFEMDADVKTDAEFDFTEPAVKLISDVSEVYFDVQPAGRVLRVVDPRGQVRGDVVRPTGKRFWSLEPGSYQVTYTGADGDQEYAANIEVPATPGSLAWTLSAVPQQPVDQQPSGAAIADTPAEQSTKFRYAHPAFSVQGVDSHSRQKLLHKLKRYFGRPAGPSGSHFISVQDLERISKAEAAPRDPRISFAYALEAYKQNRQDLATLFAYRSMQDAKHYNVPFVLPVRLICHLEIEQSHLSQVSAACRDAIQWMGQRQQEADGQAFGAAMDDLASWTGTVIGFIEVTRHERLREHVDLQSTIAALEQETRGDQMDRFFVAYQSVEEKHQSFSTKFQNRLMDEDELDDWKWREITLRREKLALAKERKESPGRYEPQAPASIDIFSTDNASHYADHRRNALETRADGESIIGIYETLGPRPTRPLHAMAVTPPQKFHSYQPLDTAALANAALQTLDDVPARVAVNDLATRPDGEGGGQVKLVVSNQRHAHLVSRSGRRP